MFESVWTLLYALMGVAAALAWRKRDRRDAQAGLVLFGVQLAREFSRLLVFFSGRDPLAGLFVIVPLIAVLAVPVTIFWCVDRRAALLLIPYLLWTVFAGYLNDGIWVLN